MSFLKNVKPNRPTTSLEGYFISMLAKSKFGKTTFAVDLVREFYDGDMSKGLMLATEKGYNALDGIHAIPITGFDFADTDSEENHVEGEQPRGFIEVIDELIEHKADIPYRFIIIDTITALERYATSYTISKLNREDKPKKRYRDITDIGWGKGYTVLAEEIYRQIERLKANSFGVFVIGHEKQKTITHRDGFEYNYTTFNTQNKTSDIIEREADMIIYGDIQVSKVGGDEENAIITSERKLLFRSDGNILCGTRIKTFPSEIECDAKVFIEEFNKAILSLYDGDKKAVEKQAVKEEKTREEVINTDSKVVSEQKEGKAVEELHEKLNEMISDMSKADKQKVAKIFKENLEMVNYKNSEDLEGLQKSIEEIQEME